MVVVVFIVVVLLFFEFFVFPFFLHNHNLAIMVHIAEPAGKTMNTSANMVNPRYRLFMGHLMNDENQSALWLMPYQKDIE